MAYRLQHIACSDGGTQLNRVTMQAEKTETKAKLADRLINGLSGENKRWNETIKIFDVQAGKLVGDVLLSSSFVSYCGPFNMAFRVDLAQEKWLKDLVDRKVPMTDGAMPLDQLTSDTEKAQWGNEGLPSDPLSIENGAIMMSSSRTTLMIDPQLQVCCLHARTMTAAYVKIIFTICVHVACCVHVAHMLATGY